MKIYLVGIKGSGMAALACYLHDLGNVVSGSDTSDYIFTEDVLRSKSIEIHNFEQEDTTNCDLIIIGNSFKRDYRYQISYIDAINLFNEQRFISVAGTHGKTTTTTFLSKIIGSSYIAGDGRGAFIKSSDLVVESCEYKATFLGMNTEYLLITSIDLDHVDYFKDIDEVKSLFELYANRTKKVVYHGDDHKLNIENGISYGFDFSNDVIIEINSKNENGVNYNFIYNDEKFCINAPIYGKHNVLNLTGAIIMALELGYKFEDLMFKNIEMPKLRFEIEHLNENIVITDYAHHPNEVKATLDAVDQLFPNLEKIIVFQFHTFTRTNFFIDDFKNVFKGKTLYLTEIFSSNRESSENDNYYEQILCKLEASQFTNISLNNAIKDKVIIFMGAGDIYRYKKMLFSID